MLESKDLRLGNLVQDKDGRVVKIAKISDSEIGGWTTDDHEYYHPDNLSGIPITKEWLEKKAGAIKINHISGYSFWSFSKSKTNKCHIDWYDNRTLWMGHQIKHCKYIHELQNAFPFLKGEELTITN